MEKVGNFLLTNV